MKTLKEIELLSWKAIWLAVKSGRHSQIHKAIDEHVERFPVSERDQVRLRTIHIVRHTQREPEEVATRIRRVSRTIRQLQKGHFSTRQEVCHAP
ncbi:hypothetical protein [Marinobacter oulmenensis]|uniref:Ribosomal 50S subunit-associated protein YjgA (DUF615 family) n=1 Tax=Marinobacter oulmenensis TaxID=643747 RepID=A0A840UK26_9GAMM|nr:hypothetical protein [Marinobacter oulmenensis]MBB5321187.1 ribosomal 50S subunit-associated protein YjgA (DUF615 family) [Marinobacter oulmenensis]